MKVSFEIEGHEAKGSGHHIQAAFADAVSDLLIDGVLNPGGEVFDFSVQGREGDGFEYRAYLEDGGEATFRGSVI